MRYFALKWVVTQKLVDISCLKARKPQVRTPQEPFLWVVCTFSPQSEDVHVVILKEPQVWRWLWAIICLSFVMSWWLVQDASPPSSLLGSSPLLQVVFNCCNISQKEAWLDGKVWLLHLLPVVYLQPRYLCAPSLPMCNAMINGGELKPSSALCSLKKCSANPSTWTDYGSGFASLKHPWQFGVWRDVGLNDNWHLWRWFFLHGEYA